MAEDLFGTPEWKDLAQDARERLEPMMRDSAVACSIYTGKVDPKMALETGYMIMLDKPIIVLVKPGMKVPLKLARVADEIVEGELSDPTLSDRLKAAMERVRID